MWKCASLDNGNSIVALLPHIFKPFFSTKIKNDGITGTGLFVAYNTVKELKGEIFVTSVPGQLTTFLPICHWLRQSPKAPGKKSAPRRCNGKAAPLHSGCG
ncbi:MAG: hypothetical protein R3C26_05785 [Calditrichia bacterium]